MDDQRDYAEEAANAQSVKDEQVLEFFDERDEVRGRDLKGRRWVFVANHETGIYQIMCMDTPFLAISDFWQLYDLSALMDISWH